MFISFRVSRAQAASLAEIAGDNLSSQSTFIRDALDAAIADYSERGKVFNPPSTA